jgi:calmodulin
MGDTAGEDEIRECFEIFDKDKDGTLTREEVGHALRALAKNPTNEELEAALEGAGNNIDLVTFASIYKTKKLPSSKELEGPMKEAFKALDKDGTGKMDAAQLRQILSTLGDPLTSDEIDKLFKEIQVGADGLDYNTFVETLVNSYALKDRPAPWK